MSLWMEEDYYSSYQILRQALEVFIKHLGEPLSSIILHKPPHSHSTLCFNMGGMLTQLFPPRPSFTEDNVPSLIGRVFIVTGGNAGVGFELAKILYSKGGTVYIAGRSPTKISAAMSEIKSAHPNSLGHLKTLTVDLSDLTTISKCASTFVAQETRLDVLWNNAGVSGQEGASIQDHEIHMATNCLGPFLLTKLLLPILQETAKSSPKASVRVVFAYSGIADMLGPPGGVSLAEQVPSRFSKDPNRNYSASKAGNWFLASEFDKRVRKEGVVCVSQTPGTLKTPGWDGAGWFMRTAMSPFFHPPKMGAYTELWAGLSPDVKSEDGGRCAIP